MADSTMIGADTSSYLKPGQAPNMLQQATGFAGLANAAVANQTMKFDLAKKQVDNMYGRLSALYGNPDLSADDIIREGAGMMARGEINKDQFSTFMTTVAKVGPQKAVEGALMNTLQAQERLNAISSPNIVENGPNIIHTTTNRLTGRVAPMNGPAAVIPKGLSPEAETAPTQIGNTPEGAPIYGTRGQFVTRAGAPMPGVSAPMPSATTPGAMGAAVRSGQGFAPVAPPAAAPAAPAQGAPRVAQGGGIVMGLPPGEVEARKATGINSGNALAGAQNEAASFRQRVTPLEKSIDALEKLGTTGSGPGTETVNSVKSFLVSAGVPGVDPNKVMTYDEAKKYLTQYAMTQSGSMGQGTNEKLAAAFTGNPSTSISNLAAVDVAKTALSLERMKQAQLTAFQRSGLPESEFSKFASQWNPSQDARAFGFDLMNAKQQADVLKSLKPADKAKFVASLRAAHDAGLLKQGQ